MPRSSRNADPLAWSPYGRHTDRAPGTTLPADRHGPDRNGTGRDGQYQGETYYGRPVVKRSHYGWLIATYLFVGGVAGAAQIIATLADLLGGRRDRAVVRAGRYLALAGALVSPALLIADLHVKSRWFNMLRIFRRTSPMSIGSWTLAAFGTLSGLAAALQLGADLFGHAGARRVGRWLGVPAAGAGALMTVYTGTLLSATSVPRWSVGYRLLAPLFGATAFSTAAAALSLLGQAGRAPWPARRRVAWLGLVATVAQGMLLRALERRWDETGLSPDPDRPSSWPTGPSNMVKAGATAALALQFVSLVGGRRWPWLSSLAAILTLASGYGERAEIVFGGNRSADRPELYFGLTRPGSAETTSEEVGAHR
ncbi:MAG: NrfD/PsrC family molybdoenzyme membrane anchor subunit [Chloroflexota bacterium]